MPEEPQQSNAESSVGLVQKETPEGVRNRAFHEEQIPPGTICRKRYPDDHDETFTDWFMVTSEPKTSDRGPEYVMIVWLEGEDAGRSDRYFLTDLGVKPPYRAVCEKHSLQIPEKFVSTSRLARWLD